MQTIMNKWKQLNVNIAAGPCLKKKRPLVRLLVFMHARNALKSIW